MAANTKVVLENTADGYLAEADQIRGGFKVVNQIPTTASRDVINGSLCFNTADSKFYMYNGSAWVEKDFISGSDLATALATKVDKVEGKGLSTNDYDNTEKQKVTDNTSARHTHSNKAILDATTVAFTGHQDISGKQDKSSLESDVASKGFTKNTGTVTSVSVVMNGATKGTVTTSGSIDLGTIATVKNGTSAVGTLTFTLNGDELTITTS